MMVMSGGFTAYQMGKGLGGSPNPIPSFTDEENEPPKEEGTY